MFKQLAQEAQARREYNLLGRGALKSGKNSEVQTGKLAVDLSVQSNNYRNETQLSQTGQRNVAGRNCLDIGGVWVDDAFEAKMTTLIVKAQSDAYFRLLERQPQLKDVFRLGNHLVWVTPNGTALVIDVNAGKETLADAEIDQLFTSTK